MSSKKKNGFQRFFQLISQESGWLRPGLGVKRWLVLSLAGITLLGIGLAVFTLDIYRTAPDTWWLPILSTLSLRSLSRPVRELIFGILGVSMILVGIWGMNRALLRPFEKAGKPLINTVTEYRKKDRGPRIVAIGGGHGLAALLRGLKEYTRNLTAVVTVMDDGGSSGELRKSMGVLPPGDIRNCLAALSNDEEILTQVFQYRFASSAGLEGHSLGNLLITSLTDITGSFEEAVAESGRVLGVMGEVLPATLHDVRLAADVRVGNTKEQTRIIGESKITEAKGKIQRIWLEPNNPPAFPPVITALLSADLIIVGPGSLYTSLLPNLLVPDLANALRASKALKFYVCNVATQPGETDGFNCLDHIRTIENYLGKNLFDLIISNQLFEGPLPEGTSWVKSDEKLLEKYPVYQSNLVDVQNPWRHDSVRLAQVIMDLYYERTGPLTV